jgi:hypothetical protein
MMQALAAKWAEGSSPQQNIPLAPQRFFQSLHRGQQYVYMAGLDFLDRADVQIHRLGKFLLRDFSGHPLPANIHAERLELRRLSGIQ